jgi:resuscitation-promoting factor RpfB
VRKFIPALVAGAVAVTVAGATFGNIVPDKEVSLSVDGATTAVRTTAGTVGEVLHSRGIEVGDHDVVAPDLETQLVDGARIAVQYGRKISVTVDGRPRTYWTTATNVSQALAALHLDLPGAKLSTSRSAAIGRQGLTFDLATLKTVAVDDGGTKRQLKTVAQTVGAALATAKITIDGDDKLSPSRHARLTSGATLRITRVAVKTVTEKKRVGYSTAYTKTNDLDRGDTKVKTKGKKGVRTTVFTEVHHNGKLQSRKQTRSKITTAARTKVVLRGTRKPKPKKEPASSSRSVRNSGGTRSTAFVTGYTYWDNSPPGSAQIARPVLHKRAGGSGTYRNPITVAVGFGPEFAFGTRFYLPKLKKYFIVEDLCGACGRSRAGAAYTIDIWLDGRNLSRGRAAACSYRVTGKQTAIRKPSSGLPVRSGSVC